MTLPLPRAWWLPLLAAGAASDGPAPAPAPAPSPADLAATVALARVDVAYAPAELTEEDARAMGAAAEADLGDAERILGVRVEGRVRLHLHADAARLRARTGARPHVSALTVGAREVHLPAGLPPRHEMVHVAARAVPSAPDAAPVPPFWEEGIATAIADEEDRIPIAAWVATYGRLGLLPRPSALLADWPEGEPSGPNPYHVAGSFVAHVLATAGPEPLRAILANPDRAGEALGRPFAEWEAEWRDAVLDFPVVAADQREVRRRLGFPVERLPTGFSPGAWRPLLGEGEPGARWNPREPALWESGDTGPVGRGAKSWSVLERDGPLPGDLAVRLRFRATEGASVLLRVHRTPNSSSDLLLGAGETFVTLRDEAAFLRSSGGPRPAREVEAVVVSRDGDVRVYLDGWLLLTGPGAFTGRRGGVAVGVKGGSVEVISVDWLPVEPGPDRTDAR